MPAVVLDLLKYIFLALIFWFLLRTARAMYFEVAGPKSSRTAPPTAASTKPPDRVTVTTQDDTKDRVFSLEDELIVGRDSKCQVVITDNYASQIHARIFRKDGKIWLEDMGSTNGTYLNRRKVTSAHHVNRGDRGRIGKTELIFRK